jgi:peroxiredoxin
MKLRSLLRASTIAVCASLLLFINRPATRFPTRPYNAPEFELPDLNGNQVHLSDFRGKAVVLNFWASWCAPCRREIPWFMDFQKEYGPRGLQIVGVSMDDSGIDAIVPFVRKTGINYVVLLGDNHVSSLYGGLDVLPTTYYISPHGVVLAFVNGVISKSEVERDIKQVLASGVEPGPAHSARRVSDFNHGNRHGHTSCSVAECWPKSGLGVPRNKPSSKRSANFDHPEPT